MLIYANLYGLELRIIGQIKYIIMRIDIESDLDDMLLGFHYSSFNDGIGTDIKVLSIGVMILTVHITFLNPPY